MARIVRGLKYLSGLAFVPVLLCLHVVRKVFVVRLNIVGSQRFGHLSLEPEVRLGLEQLSPQRGWPKQLALWSFGHRSVQSNQELAQLWKQHVRLSPGKAVGALVRAGEITPRYALAQAPMSIFGPANVLDRVNSFLAEQVRRINSDVLTALGIPANGKFVCLSIRDGSYYAATGMSESAGYQLINFDAKVFLEACEYLVAEGFTVVRVGTPTSNPMPEMKGVIDYANSPFRSELNDLVLMRECSFVVSTQTGPDALALALRKRVLYIDTLVLSQFFFGTKMATWNPRKFLAHSSAKPLTLDELLQSEFSWMKAPDDFLESKFVFERSSSGEVVNLVTSFVDEWRGLVINDLVKVRAEVNYRMTTAFGAKGQQRWGDVAAQLNGWWLRQHGEWFLS